MPPLSRRIVIVVDPHRRLYIMVEQQPDEKDRLLRLLL
jgi:hypothetical protein